MIAFLRAFAPAKPRALRVGDFEIIRDVGSDAALYLRFQRMAIKLLLPMSLVCIFVLAPLHARAGEPSAAADGWTLHATTAHNLPPHSWVLWLDVAVCYAFSLAVFRFIYHFQRDILGKFNSIEARTAATACTALVRHLPRRGVNDSRQLGERVQAHLQGLYGARSVVSCVAVPRVRPLFLLERRRKVLAERRHWSGPPAVPAASSEMASGSREAGPKITCLTTKDRIRKLNAIRPMATKTAE